VDAFNGSSGSGDVTGEVVYANYGRRETSTSLPPSISTCTQDRDCPLRSNFRGVKVYLAEQRGAAGVLLYSDPQDDGYFKAMPGPTAPGDLRAACSRLRAIPLQVLRRSRTPGVARPWNCLTAPAFPATNQATSPASSLSPQLSRCRPICKPSKDRAYAGLARRAALPLSSRPGGVKVHLVSNRTTSAASSGCHRQNQGMEYPDEW